mmetsp:Transcript_54667/g.146114  ORF Transcript_54667/g.146114 Transcript_54667/m.146114 type:complete len:270 (-) Transcript_54667:190-999(-)
MPLMMNTKQHWSTKSSLQVHTRSWIWLRLPENKWRIFPVATPCSHISDEPSTDCNNSLCSLSHAHWHQNATAMYLTWAMMNSAATPAPYSPAYSAFEKSSSFGSSAQSTSTYTAASIAAASSRTIKKYISSFGQDPSPLARWSMKKTNDTPPPDPWPANAARGSSSSSGGCCAGGSSGGGWVSAAAGSTAPVPSARVACMSPTLITRSHLATTAALLVTNTLVFPSRIPKIPFSTTSPVTLTSSLASGSSSRYVSALEYTARARQILDC